MSWDYVLTDLDGVSIGGVENAAERTLSLPLNGVPTASFRIRLDNPLASEVTSRSGDVLCKVYQDSTLRFIGDLTTAEEVGQEGGATLQCTFAGPLWRLTKRLCLNENTPADPAVVSFSAQDRAQIVKALIDRANTMGDTGIRGGTYNVLHSAAAGEWNYKPVAEALMEMAASGAYNFITMTGGVAIDNFNTLAAEAVLHGRVTSAGGTWATSGDTGDFKGYGGTAVYRNTTSDTAVGRYAILSSGPYAGDTQVQCDIGFAGAYGQITQAVVCRHSSSALKVLAGIQSFSPVSGLFVQIGADYTFLPIYNSADLTVATFYTCRFQVNAAGEWEFWYWPAGGTSPSAPIMEGQHDELATGGTMETGKVGLYDNNQTVTAVDRLYDSFLADGIAASLGLQGLDFEIVPTEPTADGIGLQIATINVSEELGTAKPNAIFEYGAGTRSARSYRRVINRDRLVNFGYSLGDTVRTALDGNSITARGLYEEVVSSDVEDAGLRQALVNATVQARATPSQEVTFEPFVNAPVYGTDYVVGDTVTARAKINDVDRFNGTVRVYGVEVSIDEQGKETISPKLVP